jgi:S-adenosylmethionine decarboxylase
MVLLAESHLAVHTWPELGAVTLDVYVCNLGGDNSGRAEALLRRLELAFAPAGTEHHRVQRGGMPHRA